MGTALPPRIYGSPQAADRKWQFASMEIEFFNRIGQKPPSISTLEVVVEQVVGPWIAPRSCLA
jgi:hypothetical protein